MPVCSTVKVRGFHLDGYGHVNHARYLEFLEDVRWEFFQDHLNLREWKQHGLVWLVVNLNISYRRSACLNDVLDVSADLARINHRSTVVRQHIRLRGMTTPIADADVTFVVADQTRGRAVAITGELRALLSGLATAA